MSYEEFLEQLWDRILSREPEQIRQAFGELLAADQAVVLGHLEKMVSEDGWHAEQVISARLALETLQQGGME